MQQRWLAATLPRPHQPFQQPTFSAGLQVLCTQVVGLSTDFGRLPVLLPLPCIGRGAVQPFLQAGNKGEPAQGSTARGSTN